LTAQLARGTWGAITAIMGVNETDIDDTNLVTTAWTHLVFNGYKDAVGIAGAAALGGASDWTITVSTSYWTTTTNVTTGVLSLYAPSGGIAQFKGTSGASSTTTVLNTYLQMKCTGAQPYFATQGTWNNFKLGTGNGFMFTCMTGIAQCEVSVADWATALTTAARTACLSDPRYLNWRMVTLKYLYAGTIVWSRTDSYWNPADCKVRSTWGPSLILSANPTSKDDNSADATASATENGRTYVWAYADGSGVQMVHLSYGTTRTGDYTSVGTGTNDLTTAPSSFSNASPTLVTENYCNHSKLLL
jgi:hypothetical protein